MHNVNSDVSQTRSSTRTVYYSKIHMNGAFLISLKVLKDVLLDQQNSHCRDNLFSHSLEL